MHLFAGLVFNLVSLFITLLLILTLMTLQIEHSNLDIAHLFVNVMNSYRKVGYVVIKYGSLTFHVHRWERLCVYCLYNLSSNNLCLYAIMHTWFIRRSIRSVEGVASLRLRFSAALNLAAVSYTLCIMIKIGFSSL